MASPCPHCGFTGPSLDPGTCGRCGVIFSRLHPAREAPPPEPAAPLVGPPDPPVVEVQSAAPRDRRTENRWALPLAFGVALVLNGNGCGRFLVYSSAGNWAHEMGHAGWRWLNGRSAVPTLFFTFYSQPGRSVLVTLLVLAGLVGLFFWARREQCRGLMALSVLLMAIFLGFAVAMPAPREHLLESFAGIFGEFWISTLWVVLFYYRFPDVVRWSRLRWAFLLLGACAYTHILHVFVASREDVTLLPWGSFFGGDGDLDQLLAAGWLVPTIRRVYFTTAIVCAAIMGCHYVYFLWQLEQSRGADEPDREGGHRGVAEG